MGSTIIEKVFARTAGRPVKPGEIVGVTVDRLFINDFQGPIVFSQFETLHAEAVVRPEMILFGMDHRVPPADVKSANNHRICRKFCKEHGIERFSEIGRHGIGHQMMVEHFTRPGEVALGTDSHATMYGALGTLACGITSSDAAVIMATGKIWLQVPASIRINVVGRLKPGVTAKDISLAMIKLAPLNQFIYKAVEIGGECIREMSVSGRLVIANMAAEMNVKCAILEADEKTLDFVGCTADECHIERPDSDAVYERVLTLDVSELAPLIACPHNVDQVRTISEVEGLDVDQVFLGSCTNGRIEDLEQALEILDGKKVHEGVRLIVVPASQEVMLEAVQKGYIEKLLKAGAAIMTPSCASCAGAGAGLIGDGERAIATTNRNFKGRMGSPNSEVYLASAYAAAAAAVTGKICDPRVFLEGEAVK
ncbi:aconitase/3-isopropylmalate dehydratase large subunit family protein [Colidextribacter sp. OB.20]|uniref:3-isopropylmalate dehydratase large subunit n=1 Tax=Colidextribacter sp. OB.20 TaxID=2304568 RepID=UPI0013687261|nr:aconitase/3-isopropylmalate dehydratase large subunit family protein [Colidextribacter sp. OB.20]